MEAANTLDPFALWPAFPASDYYGSSAPSQWHRPATGLPTNGPWRTVTVSAGTCLDANIAATATIVRGAPAIAWLESLGLPARLVAHDGAVIRTSRWPVSTSRRIARFDRLPASR